MKYVFCAYREHSFNVYKKLKKRYSGIILINKKENLTIKKIKKINPKYIFFPDWSWIVPDEIISNVNCICIHESNLPKFRGGSYIRTHAQCSFTSTTSKFKQSIQQTRCQMREQHRNGGVCQRMKL